MLTDQPDDSHRSYWPLALYSTNASLTISSSLESSGRDEVSIGGELPHVEHNDTANIGI